MRIAAIDLGTNTFLCLVADIEGGEVVRVLSDRAQVVRLGQGVHQNRELHPEALARADICLREFAAEIQKHGPVDKVVACATSAARDSQNGIKLLEIGRKHGIPIEIISGEREAEATYRGTVGKNFSGSVGIVDVGGGSTEFIVGDASGIKKRISVDVGSVRMTELFITGHPVSAPELIAMERHLREKLVVVQQTFSSFQVNRFVAVAGTPTTLAAVDMGMPFDAETVQGYTLPVSKLLAWTTKFAEMTIREREVLSGMDPKRADVIVAGVLVLRLSAEAFGAKNLEVSVRGLRYGLALIAAAAAGEQEKG